jgi:hypothetical protein
MKITKRIANVKGHTTGFIINNNKRVTRGEAVKLARRNRIDGVVAKKGADSWYVTSRPGAERKLYDLPTVTR